MRATEPAVPRSQMNDCEAKEALRGLATARSKHSAYQVFHPGLIPILGEGSPCRGKHEAERQSVIGRLTEWKGASVLDIGANTGYFSLAALEAGAARVVSREGNREHAQFMRVAAKALGLEPRWTVCGCYHAFDATVTERFEVTLCLNVLHHLGDDFGDSRQSKGQASDAMVAALNQTASTTRILWMQMGFNWKGDVRQPLFERGTKGEMIDFVRRGTEGRWRIDEVLVLDPRSREYMPANEDNLVRYDALGEFLNRPLFRMTSLVH